jgi:excisionase family DNA binding protein
MTRGKSEARAGFTGGSTAAPPKRGPARAGKLPGAAESGADASDIFDRLAQCSNLLTVKELSALLAVSSKTVYGYIGRGLIPHYKIAGSVRFRARDIAEWLRSHAA